MFLTVFVLKWMLSNQARHAAISFMHNPFRRRNTLIGPLHMIGPHSTVSGPAMSSNSLVRPTFTSIGATTEGFNFHVQSFNASTKGLF